MAVAGIDIAATVREAGVVGAGGAGFPTHVKLANKVDTVIANGAECEPVLEADKYIMMRYARDILRGMQSAMECVGAKTGVIAVKRKNQDAVAALNAEIAGSPGIRVEELGNYYPAGDELVLIRQVTGRIVPPGKLPFDVGVIVSNIATLKNIAAATEGRSVISRAVTVAGEVRRPFTGEIPVGTSIADCITHAGGTTVPQTVIVVGGPVIGALADETDTVTKLTGGIIVLPHDHVVVQMKRQPVRLTKLLAKMCCTCQECTILCPRNALGHPIFPAKIMSYAWHIDEILDRIELGDLDDFTERMVYESLLCCQCGVCELYACIFGLSPNKVYALVSAAVRKSGLKVDFTKLPMHEGAMFDYRKLPALTLARKLDLERYLVHTEFEEPGSFMPATVRIPLRQHIGIAAVASVRTGDRVKEGECIGTIPENALGAAVHASIDGVVKDVTDSAVTIVRE